MANRPPETGLARALRYATWALLAALVGGVAFAAFSLQIGLLFNTGLPLAIAAIPLVVRYRYDYRLNPVLSLIIVVAASFHAFGALGLYDAFGWYDQVAHGVAGVLVGGTGYALVQVVDTQHEDVVIPPTLRFVFIFVFAMAVGVTWELGEFGSELAAEVLGGEPILSQYDLADVVMDLAFDGIGAVVVGLWGTSYFDDARALLDDHVGSSDYGDRAGERPDARSE